MNHSFVTRFALSIVLFLAIATSGVIFLVPVTTVPAGEQGSPALPNLVPSPSAQIQPAEALYPAWWGSPPNLEHLVLCKDAGKCTSCHEQESHTDLSHAIACTRCHKGDSKTEDKAKAHAGLIADPGDLRTVEQTCGQCHGEEVRKVKQSSMALVPRMINHTRFAFGGQASAASVHATVALEDLKQVPHPSESLNLGDDLLRRSCLRCHLYTRGSARWGEHRGLGCSACHVAYPNSGDGKPRVHALVRDAGITACLKCHNSNHVGTDYVGLFEKDFERGFRSPFSQGRQSQRIYGSEQHRLTSDIHFRGGMGCMDCHTLDEVHGTGEIPRSTEHHVKITCEGCHVHGDHPGILKKENGDLILMKGQGRNVPRWDPKIIPHSIDVHQAKLKCSACHAAWSFQDYGFHLMLEERADYWKWAPTAAQNDPQVQELLSRHVGTQAELVPPSDGTMEPKPQDQWELPASKDWLTGEVRAGAWFRGYTERTWSRPALGLDHTGRVSVMRPMYQYVVSHVDASDNLLLDRQIPITGAGVPALIINPYAPHTISARGRSCHECHGNPKAAGLGAGVMGIENTGFKPVWRHEQKIPGHSFLWDAQVDDKGNALQYSSHASAGPLEPATVMRLLKPSNRHRTMWFKFLTGQAQLGASP